MNKLVRTLIALSFGFSSYGAISAHASALPTTAQFQANDYHRVLDPSVQTNSPTVTRMEFVPHGFTMPVAVTAKPKLAPRRPHLTYRASRSRRIPPRLTSSPKIIGYQLMLGYWSASQWTYLDKLWEKESNWSPYSTNSNGACGIPQALPCSKINDMSVRGQITWGLGYIKGRYGSPSAAWNHWLNHGWY